MEEKIKYNLLQYTNIQCYSKHAKYIEGCLE